jgi:hypothetical protein
MSFGEAQDSWVDRAADAEKIAWLAFGSAKTWLPDCHRHSYEPSPVHTHQVQRRAAFGTSARTLGWAAARRFTGCGMNSILSVQPTASAYLLSDDMEGACFPATFKP